MTRLLQILFSIAILLSDNHALCQHIERYNTFNYNVNEGLLHSNIGDLDFDKNNFCWISFATGLQKFNGKTFSQVPVQEGLPVDKGLSLFSCKNGDLLVSHPYGISKYDINTNKFSQVFTNNPKYPVRPVIIGEDNGKIYFFTGEGKIACIDTIHFKIISESKKTYPVFPFLTAQVIKFSENIIDHKVAFIVDHTLYSWDLEKQEQIAQSDRNKKFSAATMLMLSPHEVICYLYDSISSFISYDFRTGETARHKLLDGFVQSSSRIVTSAWNNKILLSAGNRLFETDSRITGLTNELVNLQNLPIAGNNTIVKIKSDHFGNLYLVTINSGFIKVIKNNYQVKYYGTPARDSNYTISILPDKENNRVLVGTSGNGLLVFDTMQQLKAHIKYLPDHDKPFGLSGILKTPEGAYLLFIIGQRSIWHVSSNLKTLTEIPFSSSLPVEKSHVHYFSKILSQHNNKAYVLSDGNIFKLNIEKRDFKKIHFADTYTMTGLFYKDHIITHTNDELLFIDTAACSIYKRVRLENTSLVRCFNEGPANKIYVGSNNGIFEIDSLGKKIKHITTSDGLPDACIYAIETDSNATLWCSSNKGLFSLNDKGEIFQLRKADGLQENEFNTNVSAKTADGELYFGGINGVSSFYPQNLGRYQEKINILVTGIKVNNENAFPDTASWNINTIKLPHNRNSLSFDFIAMADNNPDQYVYQYRMIGIDEEWIQNMELQTIRYILPPGKYKLQLFASRNFDARAKPLKEIFIHIKPPFWQTWWFRISMAVILITVLAFIINRYNTRKYKRKLAELQSEHKIQMERERISRDLHDSIGAYANAVLYKTDLLQQETMNEHRNELMKDLRFASKDIITSLRETIWALQKEEYNTEECLMRIRNFIQPFNRYYPHIQFSVKGTADTSKKLNNNKSLNLVRIVQEAVTNAIKHANATHIDVSSEMLEDVWKIIVTDNGTGFIVSKMEKAGGNGLGNMKQRAKDAGFDIILDSAGVAGTSITILVRL